MRKTSIPKTIGKPALNALNQQGFVYLEDLSDLTEKDYMELHGVGPKAVSILKNELKVRKIPSKLLS